MVSALVFLIFVQTRITYGHTVVTHITTWPHKAALLFLLVALVESIFLLILQNVVFSDDFVGLITFWFESDYF